MGNINNNSLDGDLICEKCLSHLLLEITQYGGNIILKKYCFCGKSTSILDKKVENLLLKFNYYDTMYNSNKKLKCGDTHHITKYCYLCHKFFCQKCSSTHQHKNLTNTKDYAFNCKYHYRKEKLIGYCKKCRKSFCEKCIKTFHNNHEIIYTKDLVIKDEIIKKYKNNLNQAFLEFMKLMKLKYGNDIKLQMNNISKKQNVSSFTLIDQQILFSLELLKTFLDLYNYHKSNGTLNYQTISNLLKHINFEILRIKDNNKNSILKNDPINLPNNNINIYLKIDLLDEEYSKNEINLNFVKILNKESNITGKNLLKLKNGNLAYIQHIAYSLYFYKNLKEEKKNINTDSEIIDFIQLENEQLVILFYNKIAFYNIKDLSYNKEKKIQLDVTKEYYKLKNASNNNMALLSYTNNDSASFFTYLKYPDYKLEEFMLIETNKNKFKDYKNNLLMCQSFYEGDLIKINNTIIICFAIFEYVKIFFYDINTKTYESIKIDFDLYISNEIKGIYKINKDKIFFATNNSALIVNIKKKQMESVIHLERIYSIGKIGKYMLLGAGNNKIMQINIKNLEINNEFVLNDYKNVNYSINSFVDIGNNQFCTNTYSGIFLFNYQ